MRRRWLSLGVWGVLACTAPGAGRPVVVSSPVPQGPCSASERQMLNRRVQETQPWTDTVQLADATPRLSLAAPIARLQELRRTAQAQAADWPPCARIVYQLWLQAMDAEIASRLAFSAQQPYEAQQAEADRLYRAMTTELKRLTP